MEHCAEGWIWRSEIAERCHDIADFVVNARVTRRKQKGFLRQGPRSDVTQWGVIVEHIESTPKRGADQIVFPTLQLQVPELNCGCSAAQPDPVSSAVNCEEESELCAREEQPGVHMVLDNRPNHVAVGQIAGN